MAQPKPVVPAISSGRVRLWQVACLLLVLCCAGLFWWARSLRAQLEPWKADPALEAFWSQFFDSGLETDVVLGDTSFAVAEDTLQRPIPLNASLN